MPELGTKPLPIIASVKELVPVRVRSFEPGMEESWDRFVGAQPGGSFFHLTAWKRVLEKTYGYLATYWFTERNGEITGVAPTFLISNWMMGRCLMSIPFAVYGGICAADAASEQALRQHLESVAVEQGVDYLELRQRAGTLPAGFLRNPRYSTFTLPLVRDAGAVLKNLPKDIRYMIRKAEKHAPTVRSGHGELDVFYRLLATNLRRLGTPLFPRALFENLIREYGDRVDLRIIYVDGKPVSGACSFIFRDSFQPYYVGSVHEAREMSANNYLWWELIRFAAESGLRTFDFGRSKNGTGAYAFKKKFKPEIEDLNYQILLVKRKVAPNFSPANPQFDLATRVWSRLPLDVTKWLGPRIVRWFP